MFCPQCATENDWEQAYCHRCGQALSDVRLGLHGAPSASVAKLRSGSELINGGIGALLVFMFIATIIALLGVVLGQPILPAIAMINALLGSVIGLPLIIVGKLRVNEATRLLKTKPEKRALGSEHGSDEMRTSLQSPVSQLPPRGSITEHTTLDLNRQHKS
jgi:hypothetical protein